MAIENLVLLLKARESLLVDELAQEVKDYGFLNSKNQVKILDRLYDIKNFMTGYNYKKYEADIILSEFYKRGDLL